MRHSATILREVWCSGLVVTTSSRSASTSRINSKIVTSRRRRRSNSARRWRGISRPSPVRKTARSRSHERRYGLFRMPWVNSSASIRFSTRSFSCTRFSRSREHAREILAETPDATQRDDLARGLVLGVGRYHLVTLGLDLPDQLQDRNEPSTQAVQFGPKMARHLAPVTGAQDGKIALP